MLSICVLFISVIQFLNIVQLLNAMFLPALLANQLTVSTSTYINVPLTKM